jgi:hypothetical protein
MMNSEVAMIPLLVLPVLLSPQHSKNTPPFNLATEYVRQTVEFWEIQAQADQDAKEDRENKDESTAAMRSLMTAIRNATRFRMALDTDIGVLQSMHMKREPATNLLEMQIDIYKRKIRLFEELKRSASIMLAGHPQPGVDYGKLMARAPEITAQMGELDRMNFQWSAMWFGALVDMKPDSQNHVSHILLTKEQRQSLIDRIDGAYGPNLDADRRYNPACASVFKGNLLNYKCADEPWD